ncbi:methyl-accepting chemotaxis protein [Reinekea marinisedimentorum]|uniref:Methyl-accepting chemotaxis protein n=1 Tax=Reinekea marinisedimentorum TaxID=230495 RepID=A0A4R3IBI3_9GAMM|nr:methyl-accepting chemotaxis protein [Reinekea marinisedimentorum]TCS43003.1 methyl-accepting chemotaxis protein [Reinekea marinisedimentorum]
MKFTGPISLVNRAILVGVILISTLVILAFVAIRGFESTRDQLSNITNRASPLKAVVSDIQVGLLSANLVVNRYAQAESTTSQQSLQQEFQQWESSSLDATEKLAEYSDDSALNASVVSLAAQNFQSAEAFMEVVQREQQVAGRLNEQSAFRDEMFRQLETELTDIADYVDGEASMISARLALGRFSNLVEALFELTASAMQQTDPASVLDYREEASTTYQEWQQVWQVIEQDIGSFGSVTSDLIVQSEGLFTGAESLFVNRSNYLKELQNHERMLVELHQMEVQAHEMISSLIALAEGVQASAEEKTLNQLASARSLISIFGVIATVVAIVIIWNLIIGIKRPINAIQKGLRQISEGDLSTRLPETGGAELVSIVRGVNALAQSLSEILAEVSNGANLVKSTSAQAHEVNSQIKTRVRMQMEETHAVAAAVTEMESAISQVATNAEETSAEVHSANREALENKELMDSNVVAIQDLDTQLQKASQAMLELKTSSEDIEKIMVVIQSIAEQTNLLALNAAIEAARAGEQGRGFAVVADEVRSLAKRTQDATSEISGMIETLQQNSEGATKMMQASQADALNSVEKAREAGEALERLLQNLSSIDEKSTSIASAAEQQTAVAKEVAENVVRISDLSAGFNAGVGQADEQSQVLVQLAQDQVEMVGRFKL